MKQKKKKKYVSKFVELFLNELFVEFILHNSGTWLQCGACVSYYAIEKLRRTKKKVEESSKILSDLNQYPIVPFNSI